MSFATEATIIYNDKPFPGAKQLGFTQSGTFVLSLYKLPATEKLRGGYWTSIPISSKEYRRGHQTKAAFEDHGDRLVIYSDWGDRNVISAPRDVLDLLVAECIDNELPQLETR